MVSLAFLRHMNHRSLKSCGETEECLPSLWNVGAEGNSTGDFDGAWTCMEEIEKSSPVSGLNKRCQWCEGATNSQIRRSGQNKLFCPLLVSAMLSLTIAHALAPEPRLGAKTTLHYDSFGVLKMCPCTSCTGTHLTLSKTPSTPTGGSGKPCMGEKPTPWLFLLRPASLFHGRTDSYVFNPFV